MKQRNKTLSKSNEQFRDKKNYFQKTNIEDETSTDFVFLNGYVLPSRKHSPYKRISNLNKRKHI